MNHPDMNPEESPFRIFEGVFKRFAQDAAQPRALLAGIEGLEMIGVIPYDPGLVRAQMQGLPVTGSAVVAAAVEAIYRKLTTGRQT